MSSVEFGPRLRAIRTARGLSLSEFARRIYYSKGHVSRVETGAQAASVEFARRCDSALDARGDLVTLVRPATPDPSPEPADGHDDGMWIMTMAADGNSSFVPIGRRQVLTGGAVLLAQLSGGAAWATPADPGLPHHRQLLDAARGLGQVAPPGVVLPMLVGQAHALRAMAADRHLDAANLFARTSEFAGWMAQEAGDDKNAVWWTDQAVQVATAAGDGHTAAYALVRRALLAMYDGDAATTIGYAQQAQSSTKTPPRILGLAAQREAQGHAIAGDYDSCMRALDRARTDMARGNAETGPVVGTSHVPDPVSAVTGWCLYDLGRPKDAAAVLDQVVARIPITAVRARLRFGVRQALAHAASGDVDHACSLARPMIDQTMTVGSATILADLRRLATSLRRWNTHESVRALGPAFGLALHKGA
ncbi:helix-turn-helix domain-containing protein [Actinocrispum wychmicini]|uniref:Helix-turn-helix protein n=1 Tax=Actinocrispum wychmicini TaxID=1213861 RepID=A0A4R2ITP8_9PSEU|nr:helix-turn-helix transcriptional regulator [Actinocrispum wychmicini]TCO48921.1 helix-turn-helix protein [Actinocrispum wychmicini]